MTSRSTLGTNEFEGRKAAVVGDSLQPRSFINSTPGSEISRAT